MFLELIALTVYGLIGWLIFKRRGAIKTFFNFKEKTAKKKAVLLEKLRESSLIPHHEIYDGSASSEIPKLLFDNKSRQLAVTTQKDPLIISYDDILEFSWERREGGSVFDRYSRIAINTKIIKNPLIYVYFSFRSVEEVHAEMTAIFHHEA